MTRDCQSLPILVPQSIVDLPTPEQRSKQTCYKGFCIFPHKTLNFLFCIFQPNDKLTDLSLQADDKPPLHYKPARKTRCKRFVCSINLRHRRTAWPVRPIRTCVSTPSGSHKKLGGSSAIFLPRCASNSPETPPETQNQVFR